MNHALSANDIQNSLPAAVAEKLGWYVYLYVNPKSGKPFYVGKGKGRRILSHLKDHGASSKAVLITQMIKSGILPRLEILAHGLRDEETALRIEAASIDLLGLSELTNKVRGWKSLQFGRMTVEELAGYYAAEPVQIEHPTLLIRINKLYSHSMSPIELQEATRGIWRLGIRREGVKYAFAVFEGIVREVYEVHRWHAASTLNYETRDLSSRAGSGRWEFEGIVANRNIRNQYHGHSVQSYFKRGHQSATVYVKC